MKKRTKVLMKYYATIAVFFLAFAFSPAHAQAPAPPAIRLPSTAVVTPTPSSAPQKLTAEVWFVIDADVDCLVLCSPANHVRIVKEEGPIRVRGKFVDGDGKVETRTFKGKFVFTLEAAVTGKCEILIVPPGAKEEGVLRRMLDVQAGEGPRPPPDPGPGPGPAPTPAPIPVDGFRCLVVYEAADLAKMKPAQHAIIYSRPFRDYLDTKCVVGPDGKTREWRFWDKDVDTTAEAKHWQDAMKRSRSSTPWVILSDGKTGYEGPLPANIEDMTALIKKYSEGGK